MLTRAFCDRLATGAERVVATGVPSEFTRVDRLAATVDPPLLPPGDGLSGRSGRTLPDAPDPAWVLPRRESGRVAVRMLFCVSSGLRDGRAMIGLVVFPEELCRGSVVCS